MTSKIRRWVGWVTVVLVSVGCFTHSASALDTPNVLMAIDAMTLTHQGLFRNGTPNDGFNTFQFGPVLSGAGSKGRYRSFHFVKNNTGDGGVSHNARFHSDSPEVWTGTAFAPAEGVNFNNDYYPIIDRTQGGQIFDPAEYQIEVKFKPNFNVPGLPFNNIAPFFQIGLDQIDGFVHDEETGSYKRANDAFSYNIGSVDNPINDWYAAAPKDADGFATWTVPVTSPTFVQRGFYYAFGNGDFRTANVVTGGGKVFNTETQVYDDVNDGLDTLSFGGGPTGATPQLKIPNGVPLISLGAPNAETGVSVELKYAALKRINAGPIVSRIDENSSLTFKFGSGLGYGETLPPISAGGFDWQPNYTDQISRFDQNGMTNLIFNMRTPNAPTDGHRVLVRGGPNAAEAFDGSDPEVMVNIRAKLLPGNTIPSLTIQAKDLDGNDQAALMGGETYNFDLNLSQFNSSTFTTVSVPLSSFTLAPHVPYVTGGAFGSGFTNAGDGLKTSFDLYEFGINIPANTGLLKLELDYLELRLPEDDGLLGDFDGDEDVDGRDFLIWQRGGSPTPLSAGDLADWRANYGTGGLGALSSVSVPEPSCLVLLGVFGVALCGRRRS